ncbi:probable G-protein coupled receptor 132 [Centropristis striata]|uniref:probable G-protein coupled receptor 132 n=1 Tax=Centropristis striata TaxID=184440 RepID=UPI0027E1E496|nr:probable G-protein coupled receptor 132 [Centropristis striata]
MHASPTDSPPAATNVSVAACALPLAEGAVPLLVLYGGVLAVGVPANLLTLWLTWLQLRRNNVLAVYLWSLSLCDLTYLSTLPLWACYVAGGHLWPWSSAACKLTGFVFFTNMYASIFLLCCVSADRYVAVVYSVESRGLRRQRLAALIALAVVAVVAVGHIPVFTMREGDAAEGARRCFEPSQSSAAVTGFSYARFAVGFLLPLLLLVAANRGVLRNVQRSTGLRTEQKERVRRLAVAVVALFLVCFAPYHVVLLVRAVAFHFLPEDAAAACRLATTMYTPYTVSLGLSTINSAANPILYVLSSDNIRKDLSRGLVQVCRRARRRPRPDKIQPTRNSSDLNVVTETGRCQGPEPPDLTHQGPEPPGT